VVDVPVRLLHPYLRTLARMEAAALSDEPSAAGGARA